MERYSKLFTLANNFYSSGSPVIISAGTLLNDHENNGVLVQLKIKSISPQTIKALKVEIVAQDTADRQLGKTVEFQYIDILIVRNQEFGQKTPIHLPDNSTRSFSVKILEVIFENNIIWTEKITDNSAIPSSLTLLECLKNPELVKQYQLICRSSSQFMPKKEKDLWICACGTFNHSNEGVCSHCQLNLAVLEAIDLEELENAMNERLKAEKEQHELEEQ